MDKRRLNEVTGLVIKAGMAVHKEMGPGILESVYESCMMIELADMGLRCVRQVPVNVTYRGRVIESEGFRMDLLVEDEVVVELKSVEKLSAVHRKQLLSYLKLAKKRVGLLMNFNEVLLKDGIVRIVNEAVAERVL